MTTPNTLRVLTLIDAIDPDTVAVLLRRWQPTVQGAVVLSASRLHSQLNAAMPQGARLTWEDWLDARAHFCRRFKAVHVQQPRHSPETMKVLVDQMTRAPQGTTYILLEEV